MLKPIKSNNSPGHSHNGHTSVVGLSFDSCPGNISKEDNKMNKSMKKKIHKIINDFVKEWNNDLKELVLKNPELEEMKPETRESLGILIVYGDNGFTIDGDFYSQVKEYQEDGIGPYNFLYKLWVNIETCADSFGFYLENYGYGEYRLEAK